MNDVLAAQGTVTGWPALIIILIILGLILTGAFTVVRAAARRVKK